jgi:MATE family multidrug resistance protein
MNQQDKDLKTSFITRDTRETEDISTTIVFQNNKNNKSNMEILDEFKNEDDNTELSFKGLCAYAPGFYLNSVPLMFNRMNPYLLNMISLIFIAFYGSATLTAGFGLGNAIFMFFWQTFTQVNGETQGINCSKAFGAQDYKLMRLHFYRGAFWNICITIISACLYTNIGALLLAAGFEPEMTKQAQLMINTIIPALFLQTINEMIRNYLMSQKIAKPFVWINLASFCFFPIGGYYIIYASGWGLSGFGLFKFIVEFINLCGLIILQKKYGHEESLKRESLREIFNGPAYAQYMKDFGKILLGWYASYFGLEINTILCGMTQDTVIMACWVSYMNCFAILWTIGAGLAITARTRCGMLVGENKPLLARKYAYYGYTLALCYSVFAGIFIILMHSHIANMFTEVQAVLPSMSYQIILVGALGFFVGSGAMGSTIFRVINRAGFYSILMMINQVLISTTLSLVALFYFKLGAAGVGYAFLVSWCSTLCVTIFYMKRFDWNTLKQQVKA